ncbi:Hypothetical protein, putative [Bodo saltans]|uniref:Membrane-associated protein n=1 Tax=Bodo saltans TaxID=75058 RepID=A0A0S4JCL1_BODSA|nr:Hypothetical protein, putative [Bodo saltans]|eukprot:CUG87861.1 Hypothetical protein, putative [Bodo saltans]
MQPLELLLLILLISASACVRVPVADHVAGDASTTDAEQHNRQDSDPQQQPPTDVVVGGETSRAAEEVPHHTLELLLHRLHEERKRAFFGVKRCALLTVDYKDMTIVAQDLYDAAIKLNELHAYQAEEAKSGGAELARVLESAESILFHQIRLVGKMLINSGLMADWDFPSVILRLPQLSQDFGVRVEALSAICQDVSEEGHGKRFVVWLATKQPRGEHAVEVDGATAMHHADIVRACLTADNEGKGDIRRYTEQSLDSASLDDVTQLVFQWLGDYINGQRRTIAIHGESRTFGVADALALFGLLQQLVRSGPERVTRDAPSLGTVPEGKFVWEQLSELFRDLKAERTKLHELITGVDVMLSRRVAPFEAVQPSSDSASHTSNEGMDTGGSTAAEVVVNNAVPGSAAMNQEAMERIFAALREKLASGNLGTLTGVTATPLQQQQPPTSSTAGDTLQGGAPPVEPEYADVSWLTRSFVRVTRDADADATIDVLPLPLHASMRSALRDGSTTTLCSGNTALAPGVATRTYPGVVELTISNLGVISSLADEALLYVYREWDVHVEEQLQLLSKAFHQGPYGDEEEGMTTATDEIIESDRRTASRWYGLNEGGCVPTVKPKMFDRLLDPTEAGSDDVGGELCDPRGQPYSVPPHRRNIVRLKRFHKKSDDEGALMSPPPAPTKEKKRANQIVLALNLATSGKIVPFLMDVVRPSLFFFRSLTLGARYTLPWTVEHIHQFTLEHVASSLIITSADALQRRVLEGEHVENAVLFIIPRTDDDEQREFDQDECPLQPDVSSLAAALLSEGNKLRVELSKACGSPCVVHIVVTPPPRQEEGGVEWLPHSLRVLSVDGGGATDTMEQPLGWGFDTNSFLTRVDEIDSSSLRFVNRPKSEWRAEAAKLRLAEGCATPAYMLLLRKLNQGDEQRRAQHAIAALRFPGPTVFSPRVDYGRYLGNHFIKFLRSVHRPRAGLIELPFTAPIFSDILRSFSTATTSTRWLYLLMSSGPATEQAQCTNSLRRASMRMRDVQAAESEEAEEGYSDHHPMEGRGQFRFGVVNATTQPHFFHELGRAATYVAHSTSMGDTPSTLVEVPMTTITSPSEEGEDVAEVQCEVLVVHLPSSTLEWWGGVPLDAVERLPVALLAGHVDAKGSSNGLLKDAHQLWASHHNAERPTPTTRSTTPLLSLRKWPGWSVVPVGARKFPVLQYHQHRQGAKEEAIIPASLPLDSSMDVVLLYDTSCALCAPALLGYQQLVRCNLTTGSSIQQASRTNNAGFPLRRRGAYDVANLTDMQQHVPWAWDVLQSLVNSPGEVPPLPMLLVGSEHSHTVTLPSPWVWNQQLRSYFDVMEAEHQQRLSASVTDCGATDGELCAVKSSGKWKDDAFQRCFVDDALSRRELVSQKFRVNVRRPSS